MTLLYHKKPQFPYLGQTGSGHVYLIVRQDLAFCISVPVTCVGSAPSLVTESSAYIETLTPLPSGSSFTLTNTKAPYPVIVYVKDPARTLGIRFSGKHVMFIAKAKAGGATHLFAGGEAYVFEHDYPAGTAVVCTCTDSSLYLKLVPAPVQAPVYPCLGTFRGITAIAFSPTQVYLPHYAGLHVDACVVRDFEVDATADAVPFSVTYTNTDTVFSGRPLVRWDPGNNSILLQLEADRYLRSTVAGWEYVEGLPSPRLHPVAVAGTSATLTLDKNKLSVTLAGDKAAVTDTDYGFEPDDPVLFVTDDKLLALAESGAVAEFKPGRGYVSAGNCLTGTVYVAKELYAAADGHVYKANFMDTACRYCAFCKLECWLRCASGARADGRSVSWSKLF